jgi:Asp-tRNA(Asn)/Glu-tRNA(Gln) amidotransferase A subunit family amidase
MAGFDAADAGMRDAPRAALATEFSKPDTAAGFKLAFVMSPAWPLGEASMKTAFAQLVERLGSNVVETAELPAAFANTGGLQRAVQFRDIAKNYGPLLDAHPGMISAKLAEVIGIGRTVGDAEYEEALARRDGLYDSLGAILERYDAILTPASTGPAPDGLASTGSPAFNFLWTYLHMPAISLPLLHAGGLPLGVQLVGARGSDAKLLATSRRLMSLASAA